jgi:hypothetical protein
LTPTHKVVPPKARKQIRNMVAKDKDLSGNGIPYRNGLLRYYDLRFTRKRKGAYSQWYRKFGLISTFEVLPSDYLITTKLRLLETELSMAVRDENDADFNGIALWDLQTLYRSVC